MSEVFRPEQKQMSHFSCHVWLRASVDKKIRQLKIPSLPESLLDFHPQVVPPSSLTVRWAVGFFSYCWLFPSQKWGFLSTWYNIHYFSLTCRHFSVSSIYNFLTSFVFSDVLRHRNLRKEAPQGILFKSFLYSPWLFFHAYYFACLLLNVPLPSYYLMWNIKCFHFPNCSERW